MTFEWSWVGFLIPVAFWFISFFFSARDGTLTPADFKCVRMGFLNHGGMWSDLLILSFVNGLVVPHIRAGFFRWVGYSLAALCVAGCAHWFWWAYMGPKGQTTHIFPVYTDQGWVADLSAPGVLHLLYMIPQLAIFFAYFFSRGVPVPAVGATVLLLTVYVVFAVGQPGIFCDRRVTPETGWMGIVLLALIWIPGGILKLMKLW